MKIVRLIARLNTGGPARHVVWLTAGLPKEKFDQTLIVGTVPEGEGDMNYFAEKYGVTPFVIPEMSRELSPKDIVSLWKTYRKFCSEKPDVIHTHTAKAGTIGRVAGFAYRWLTWKTLIGKPRSVKFVHTYHGHVFHSYYGKLKTQAFLLIEKTLARFATHKIVVLSKQQKREINEDFRVGKRKQFAIIPLGIDLAPFEDWMTRDKTLRDEIGAADDEFLIGIVGRLTEIKNHSLFLQAAKLYNERKNDTSPKLKFVVIGDGNLRQKLEAESVNLGITDVVMFTGERNDLENIYPSLDIVALTSFNEGTPLSLIEAMANGRPIISTNVGGVADLLGNIERKEENFSIADRGILVESGEAENFYQGLMFLIENEDLRRVFSARGEIFAVSKYSKERLLNDIEELYASFESKKKK